MLVWDRGSNGAWDAKSPSTRVSSSKGLAAGLTARIPRISVVQPP